MFNRAYFSGLAASINLLLLPATLHPQTRQSATPITMTEREGADGRATWSLQTAGKTVQGTGQWESGEIASLVITSMKINADNSFDMTIHRADANSGLTADYKGTWRDGRVGGDYTYSLPGEASHAGNWYAFTEPPFQLPSVMHFCDVNCETLELQNGHYVSVTAPPFVDPAYSETWDVQVFTRQQAKFRRTVTGRFHFVTTYSGRVSGNHLVDTANPFHGQGQPEKIMLAWGAAINSVPGQGHPYGNVVAGDVGESAAERLADKQIVIGVLRVWAALLDNN